jgi:hypothetical protein
VQDDDDDQREDHDDDAGNQPARPAAVSGRVPVRAGRAVAVAGGVRRPGELARPASRAAARILRPDELVLAAPQGGGSCRPPGALRQQARRKLDIAEQAEHDGPGGRTLPRFAVQALLDGPAQLVGQHVQVGGAGGAVAAGGEHHCLSPGEHVG